MLIKRSPMDRWWGRHAWGLCRRIYGMPWTVLLLGPVWIEWAEGADDDE